MVAVVGSLAAILTADASKFTNALNQAGILVTKTERNANSSFSRMSKNTTGSFSAMAKAGSLFGGVLASLTAGMSLKGAQQLIDSSIKIENALKVAGLAGTELTEVYNSLFQSAQKNAAPLEALVTLYGRASLVQKELNVSQAEMLNFTDKIALALRVGGQSAAESSGALLQLSQALGAGTVRAEEFSSILEGALPIAQAAAAGLKEAGGSVAKLRQLVVDGKVSSEAFFRAFEAGAATLEDKVAGAELTVAQQFVRLQNVLIDTAGKIDKATGAAGRMGSTIETLSRTIAEFGRVVERTSDSDLGALLGWFADAIEKANQFKDVMGGVLGILQKMSTFNADMFAGREIGSTLKEENIQNRIDAAFEGTGVTPKTSRLPAENVDPVANAVSISDYKVPASSKKGRGRSRSADELQREIAQIKERTNSLTAMTAAQAGINPLVEDFGFAIEQAKAKQDLINAAQKAGITITPELEAKIDGLATGYANASAAAEKLAVEQDKIKQKAEEWNAATRDVTQGFVKDLMSGKSAAEALANALQKVIDKLLDSAFDSLFSTAGGGGSGELISLNIWSEAE